MPGSPQDGVRALGGTFAARLVSGIGVAGALLAIGWLLARAPREELTFIVPAVLALGVAVYGAVQGLREVRRWSRHQMLEAGVVVTIPLLVMIGRHALGRGVIADVVAVATILAAGAALRRLRVRGP